MFQLIKNYFISSTIVICVLTLLFLADAKICNSIDVRNHVQNLNKLKNCTEIIGDLMIVLLENTKSEIDYEPYVFPELQKVTGFVLLYKLKHLTSLGKLFPNLRLIRGLSLLQNYALIVYDLPNIREIGTTKLSYIARGYVKTGKAPNLCYVDTIDWQKIGENMFVQYQKHNRVCSPCPAQCNGFCWNQDECQVFTDNCHMECLGCTKNNSNAHCEVCKNYDNDGVCVAECPPEKYILKAMSKCVSETECFERNQITSNHTSQNRTSYFIYQGKCRNDCPEETRFNSKINSCDPCGDDCVKWCGSVKLVNPLVIENMKGCTHINGSVSILNLASKQEQAGLYVHLRSLKYIRDYLLIARNEAMEDLGFLLNLEVIAGVNLYANKSVFVYDNRNLKKLWRINESFPLKIKNGTIGFHDNELLCLTEIEKFAEKTGIKYSETDVSKYSNMAYCSDDVNTDFEVKLTKVSTTNVTLEWEKKDASNELYYTIHYTDSNSTEERGKDVCSADGWDSFSTSNNSVLLDNLKVFTTYYFYVKTYLKNMEFKKSAMKTFQTLPDDPDSPSTFTAYPVDHNSVKLTWTKPYRSNGILNKYVISVYRIDDDPSLLKNRDYCTNPFSDAGSEIDKREHLEKKDEVMSLEELKEMYDLGDKEITQTGNLCCSRNDELNIRLKNDIWLYLCDKNSQSKFGVDFCKHYFYEGDVITNGTDITMEKRSGEKTFSRKKSYVYQNKFLTEVVSANVTNHTINQLRQYSLYAFYILACNQNYNGRRLCSSVLQTTLRTLKHPKADDVSDFTVKTMNQDIVMTWTEPKNPNGFILAYNLYYRKDMKHSKNQTLCISQEKFLKYKNLTLKNMLPGGYYLMLQAVSLAGPGSFSDIKYIEIDDLGINPLWFVIIIILILATVVLAIAIVFRIKKKQLLDDIQLITQINPDYASLSYEVDEWEMDREDIELHQILGQGTFGRVFLGQIKSSNVLCAVKTINEESSYEERVRFLTEASTMKSFTNGPHVVKLCGVVSKSHPPLVLMELMERGDLKKYLLKLRDSCHSIPSNEIYRMAIEIADGLAYLTSKKYVHRDLAARNCMVGNDKTVKIGDFGMTRDIYQSDYYKKGSGSALLPVRWMAPESIADGVNTYDSDIWGYGIVLWEIVTLAAQPYQGLSNEEVTQFVVSKGTLDRPPECPNLLWEIMEKCWNWYPNKRPTCFEVVELLQDNVGDTFKSLSFYHSPSGQEYSMGYERPNNSPALAITNYRGRGNNNATETESQPLNDTSEIAASHTNDPEFIPPSSPKTQPYTGQFH
ncbi:unnamed protein product [Ceutorhynchus assimilis]|uniref:receptor protein-tyrosine kinase n=1 Tax=Ceutorhynchus assimilis TaxID=467358 RepID=A0A9P0GQQ9_9CUCU|nr:unnamed protein product [Ceutorhynchus assimilis]